MLLTGGALHLIRPAVGLARLLQPCIVVLEDADVAFILTTDRADLLGPALAARPGRVDLALEIPLPDAEARRRLIELYGRGLTLQLRDADVIVERTAGVTASFIKELLRKAALRRVLLGGRGEPVEHPRPDTGWLRTEFGRAPG